MYDILESVHRLLNALSTVENLTPSVLCARTELEVLLSKHDTYRSKRAASKARMTQRKSVKEANRAVVESRKVQRQLIKTLTNAQTLYNKSLYDAQAATVPEHLRHTVPPFTPAEGQLKTMNLISESIVRYLWQRKNTGVVYPLDTLKSTKPFKTPYEEGYILAAIKRLNPFITET